MFDDRNRNLPGITGTLHLSPSLIDEDVMASTIYMPQFIHLKLGDVTSSSRDFVTERTGIHPVLEIALYWAKLVLYIYSPNTEGQADNVISAKNSPVTPEELDVSSCFFWCRVDTVLKPTRNMQ